MGGLFDSSEVAAKLAKLPRDPMNEHPAAA
jgi:hypothetical protein